MSRLFDISQLNNLGDMIVDALIDEFVQQGHSNTGEFVKSIVREVEGFADGLALNISFAKYGIYQDKGVSASKIPFTMGSGAGQSKYIDALTTWVLQRGIVTSQKQAKSMAFAIAKKHKKEGMPTKGAFAYSLNGRRTGFFTDTMSSLESEIEETLTDIFSEQIKAILYNAIDDVQKKVTNARQFAA